MTSSGPNIGDNEYDAYRKRMMLAYRFRPNPLVSEFVNFIRISYNNIRVFLYNLQNNPRRAYY